MLSTVVMYIENPCCVKYYNNVYGVCAVLSTVVMYIENPHAVSSTITMYMESVLC